MKKRAKDEPTPSLENGQPQITKGVASSNSSVQGPSQTATVKTMKNSTSGELLSRRINLPVEVLETILREAWVSIPTDRAITRWELFQFVRGVSRQWREVMLQVAIRNVVVHLGSDADLVGYLLIGLIASGRYGHLDRSIGEALANATGPSNAVVGRLTIPSKDTLQDIFRRSSIFIHFEQPPPSMEARSWKRYIRSLVKDSELEYLFPPPNLFVRPSESPPSSYLARLSRVIPDAKRVSTTLGPLCVSGSSTRGTDATSRLSIILPFVDSLPSATELYIYGPAWFEDLSQEALRHALSQLPAPMRNLRYLYFQEYPSCPCDRGEHGPRHSRCYIPSLMAVFKHVEHLRIDSPMILKYMVPLPALHTLTLVAAVPVVSGPAAHAHNSIVAYNIPAALKHGLFRDQLAAGKTPKIICITGEVEPVGWDGAQAACSRRGVVLIRKRDSV
ncbi:hypothetical protein C8Q70DRAFT_1055346 [Cubamyces menziesii]|nr:hypothetical protein C8Q70DRAFT_1055346 [Cubamyces menziesii]